MNEEEIKAKKAERDIEQGKTLADHSEKKKKVDDLKNVAKQAKEKADKL